MLAAPEVPPVDEFVDPPVVDPPVEPLPELSPPVDSFEELEALPEPEFAAFSLPVELLPVELLPLPEPPLGPNIDAALDLIKSARPDTSNGLY